MPAMFRFSGELRLNRLADNDSEFRRGGMRTTALSRPGAHGGLHPIFSGRKLWVCSHSYRYLNVTLRRP
jgi:hypothetical protein